MSLPDDGAQDCTEEGRSAANAFRFKRQHADEHGHGDPEGVDDGSRRRHRRHHPHHRKHKRRRVSPDPLQGNSNFNLPPDIAFRESLFDALGDDEGADFWQGVYGQPIHNYSRTYTDADTGELETMDDEQYAQYVRRKMWEKSAEGMQATREEQRRERKRQEEERTRREQTHTPKQETRPPGEQDFIFDWELDASLKRGQSRKERKRWQQIWKDYMERWEELQSLYESRRETHADDSEQLFLRNKIAWPVEFGKRTDVLPENIEQFFNKVTEVQHDSAPYPDKKASVLSILKAERVKWHPDKIQQRYGFMHVEPLTMEGVTAVFQVLDRMWSDRRGHD